MKKVKIISEIKSETIERTVTEEYFKISGYQLINLLKEVGWIPLRDIKEVSVEFRVPGGGDWSGECIEVTDENPVTVTIRYDTIEVKKK